MFHTSDSYNIIHEDPQIFIGIIRKILYVKFAKLNILYQRLFLIS